MSKVLEPIVTSIFDLFKIGPGPSSSHTIGPMAAAYNFQKALQNISDKELKRASAIEVHLFGSLSATGRGHGTDRAVTAGLLGWEPETCDSKALSGLLSGDKDVYAVRAKGVSISFSRKNIYFEKSKPKSSFANTLIIKLVSGRKVIFEKEYYSIGGGFIKCKGQSKDKSPKPVYAYSSMTGLKETLSKSGISIKDLALANEKAITLKSESEINNKLDEIILAMETSVKAGIHAEGVLPGPIGLFRKASLLYKRAHSFGDAPDRFLAYLNAYALAASEENAAGQRIVTAPTSGSCGVIPAILYLLKHHFHISRDSLREGLLVAAVIGFIAKHNASISGAEVGCQGEVGVASSMAAGMLAYINGYNIDIIENAAEIALEHHLGLTCDPVGGYVQIPCIERNAVAAVEAYNAYLLASAGDPSKQKLKFDQVVLAMKDTGKHMSSNYKETSRGGLARCVSCC
ncbi:MAG: L-serine ammonia-lyase [Candidatus Omnitrophota bacterium]|jgi:L-serine dehydratase